VDVTARVVSTARLSSDYNVIALAAPAIAASAEPGQFVMVKPGRGFDPLLRRPFSVFEVLRHDDGTPTGISVLNKRIGPTTQLLFDADPDDRVQVLGPLGRPFVGVAPPAEAWMVAGGVGLAPFALLAESLTARGTRVRLFYGARRDAELFYLDWFAGRGVRLALATEDGSRGAHGRVTVPLERALSSADAPADLVLYACGPEPMLAAVAQIAAKYRRRVQVSVERVMGCGLGGCYSCVIPVRDGGASPHFVRSCLNGPVFDGDQIVWR
jgi:dihydroorotate dehydrogenase electron transfer subunit